MLRHQSLKKQLMACPTGIEPVTPSLEGWCSIRLSYGHHSNRISPQISMNWSGWRDLNSRHPGPKPGALPGYATPRKGDNIPFRLQKVNLYCLGNGISNLVQALTGISSAFPAHRLICGLLDFEPQLSHLFRSINA
jgi:hypothetical protein